MTSTTHVNFICLKWGTKYGPEYVNRLYSSIKRFYSGPCTLYCFTDSGLDLADGIVVKDIAELRVNPSTCFTVEKIFLFDMEPFNSGKNVFLDIDVLLMGDVTAYLEEYDFVEPRFTINQQPDFDYKFFADIHSQYGPNYVNSSFISWKEDQLNWLTKFYLKNQTVADFMYEDLDTFLFHSVKKKLKYHPYHMIYSYNSFWKKLNRPIVFFNTSHGRGVELHQGPDWAREAWVGSELV